MMNANIGMMNANLGAKGREETFFLAPQFWKLKANPIFQMWI